MLGTSTLAVGKPSSRPRWSPRTTTPRASNGRPSISAASSTWPPASARRMAVELIGSSTPSLARQQLERLDVEVVLLRPARAAARRCPARWLPKWKSSPTTMRCAPRQSTSTRRHERLRFFVGLRSRRSGPHGGVDAGCLEQLELLVEVGQQLRRRLGADDRRPGGGRRSRTTECAPSRSAPRRTWAMIAWCPRCTPSYAPIVSTERFALAGSASGRAAGTGR